MSKNLLDALRKDAEEQEETLTMEEMDEMIGPLLDCTEEIQDNGIQNFVKVCLYMAPEAFWQFSCATTHEDHPPDEFAEGGTVLHTQRVFRYAREMGRALGISQNEMDVLLAAAILHDITKFTENEEQEFTYDRFHPYTADGFFHHVITTDKEVGFGSAASALGIAAEDFLLLSRLIRVQQGHFSPIPETVPENNLEWAMHLADLLATRAHHLIDEEPELWRWIKETKN